MRESTKFEEGLEVRWTVFNYSAGTTQCSGWYIFICRMELGFFIDHLLYSIHMTMHVDYVTLLRSAWCHCVAVRDPVPLVLAFCGTLENRR